MVVRAESQPREPQPASTACRAPRPRRAKRSASRTTPVGIPDARRILERQAWSIASSPNGQTIMTGLRTDDNGLIGVSCTSARACEAVGLYFNVGLSNYQTLIESWNGSSWSLVPSSNGSMDYNALAAVSCHQNSSFRTKPNHSRDKRGTRNSCTAVGNYFDTTVNAYQTLDRDEPLTARTSASGPTS